MIITCCRVLFRVVLVGALVGFFGCVDGAKRKPPLPPSGVEAPKEKKTVEPGGSDLGPKGKETAEEERGRVVEITAAAPKDAGRRPGTSPENSADSMKRKDRGQPAPAPLKPPAEAAVPKVQPETPGAASGKSDQKIVLNFDDADLYEVIKTIAELLKINYIVDPGIKGRVTIQTAGGFSQKDLFPIFFQILEANGLTAFREGNVYKIVPMKDVSRMPIRSRAAEDSRDLPMSERVMIQIIPLRFISSQELTKLLTPFVSEGGAIVADKGSNTLVVVDKGANILKVLRLVEAFDVDILERVSYKVFPVKYLDVEEVAKSFSEFSTAYTEGSGMFVKFIPITRLNTLFVVSTSPQIFQKVEDILRQMDVIDKEVAPRVYVYFVKNGEAEDLAMLLEGVFLRKAYRHDTTKDTKKTTTQRKAGGTTALSRNPFSQSRLQEQKAKEEAAKAEAAAAAAKAKTATVGSGGAGEGTLSGTLTAEIHITPDPIRNALIIEATPADYRVIDGVLQQIDVLPRQVLIEATIAEISVNTSTELGMEWAFGKGAAEGKASFAATINKMVGTGTDAAASGLKYSIGVTDKWYAALHALASEGRVNILSSPHVLASDNKEAKIDVSREIPVASGKTTIATSTVIGETSIQYRDTGVILSVTPHINDRGLVTMDISEEVSDLEKQPIEVAGDKYPAFFKRTVSTTLTVKHGQTIAIGGLIKDKEDESITGVPCLIKVPVVRYLFGDWGKDVEKIELIVLITPRVVANLDDVDAVTDEFKQKVKNVVRRFYP